MFIEAFCSSPMNKLDFQTNMYSRRQAPLFNNQQFNCEQCGKKYLSKTSLSLHTRLECGKEPQFQCPECLRKFHQGGSLKRHLRSLHPNSTIPERSGDVTQQ